jgi:hypothetical protein
MKRMKNNTAPKSKDISFTISIDPNKVFNQHLQQQSGAGQHQDRRSKRLKTRQKQLQHALSE